MPLGGPFRMFSLTVASLFQNCGKDSHEFCQPTLRELFWGGPSPLAIYLDIDII
jgi:hypothetical protein